MPFFPLHRVQFKAGVVVAVCLVALGLYPRSACAQTPGEYDVKAAFLLNFAKFVEWPDNAFGDRSSPLVLGIVGDDPFGGAMDRLSEKTVNGRVLVVRRLSGATDDYKGIQMLFISASERQRVPAILKQVAGMSILTVSDLDDFCGMGGIIQLLKQDQRIRFEVNLTVGVRAHLNISSKLLGLARTVHSEKGT